MRHIWFTFIPTLNFWITSRLHEILAKKGVTQPPGSCDQYTVHCVLHTIKQGPANYKIDRLWCEVDINDRSERVQNYSGLPPHEKFFAFSVTGPEIYLWL